MAINLRQTEEKETKKSDAVLIDEEYGRLWQLIRRDTDRNGNHIGMIAQHEVALADATTDGNEKKSQLSQDHLMVARILKSIIAMLQADSAKNMANLIKAIEHHRGASYAKQISTDADYMLELLRNEYDNAINQAKKYGSSIKSGFPKTKLDDIKGQKDVKDFVRSFIYLYQHQELFEKYKLDGGMGVLMYGAPGTGKTMFAEAIANALGLPLFIVTPADIFKSYVGASEQAVKQLFQDISIFGEGAVLFIDECESIFSKRSNDSKAGKAEVTSELLQRMNGEGVDTSHRIMLAATNRPDAIDPAYLRYKRFSNLIHIAPPDQEAIAAIIESKFGIKEGSNETSIPVEGGAQTIRRFITEINNKVYPMTLDAAGFQSDAEYGKDGYYSAADICGIVEEACRQALELTMKNNPDASKPIEKLEPVTFEMLMKAMDKRKPSISQRDKKYYDNFRPGEMQSKPQIVLPWEQPSEDY